MPLSPGTRLGRYEILSLLGSGGMGEVYRAADTRLGREVALKALPDAFTRDPERLARFEQEARLLAALNHPSIAAIYGLEEAGREEPSREGREPLRFLVLELVPGQTLAERIARGPLPVEEVLHVCRQIAEALEAAHERGIIHRDLKPANVKVTPEGKVKVLDFGLAKAFAPEGEAMRAVSPSPAPGASPAKSPGAAGPPGQPGWPMDRVAPPGQGGLPDEAVSQSPTATYRSPTGASGGTGQGVILGTAAYMSPEQARGKPLDKRTDIWSFGCVLYEALTGRQAFSGETVSDTMAAILTRDPDWSALPPGMPASVLRLLRRCLKRDPAQRLRDIGDARVEIEEMLAGAAEASGEREAASPRPPIVKALPWVATVLATILAGVGFLRPSRGTALTAVSIKHFVITLPPNERLDRVSTSLALSPDGSRLVYVVDRGPTTQFYLREMDQPEAKPIPGTEGARTPFFSPDGRWLGFYSGPKLMKVSLEGGGMPVALCDGTPDGVGRGAFWGSGDTIILAPSEIRGLYRVSANGGCERH